MPETDDAPAREHGLAGLEHDNLLAFLALLGLLCALDRARPAWSVRARWIVDEAPLEAKLHLAAPATRAAITEAAAEGLATLAAAIAFGERRDLSYPKGEAHDVLRERPLDPMLGALMSDGAVRDDGRIWPTPLCFLFGQGHQHFLSRLADVPRRALPPARGRGRKAVQPSAADCLAEALFQPWLRPDRTEGFRWDPAEDRRYALRAEDPSGDPAGMQHGANRLAAVGLAALSGCAVLRRGETRFLNRTTGYRTNKGRAEIAIAWPIWRHPARLSGILALSAHPALQDKPADLAPYGVVAAMRAHRISVGKFFNVTRAEAL